MGKQKIFQHAKLPKRRGRPIGGQLFTSSASLEFKEISKNDHHITSRLYDFFIVGIYLNPNQELDDKANIITEILEEIYSLEEDPKILMGGDMNLEGEVKSNTNEINTIESVMLNFNMAFKSDITGKIKTHFNHNGGSSQVDYIIASHNFPQLKKINYVNLHAGSDHLTLQTSFRAPRYLFKPISHPPSKMAKLDIQKAKEKLKDLNAKIESCSVNPLILGKELEHILKTSMILKTRKKKRVNHQTWFDEHLKLMKNQCITAYKQYSSVLNLKDDKEINELKLLEVRYQIAKKAYKHAIYNVKKDFERQEQQRFVQEHNSLQSLYKSFRKSNASSAKVS